MSSSYYSLKKINKLGALYNMIIGQRSNGKTYSFKQQALENYCNKGERCAYIRRYDNDIAPKNLSKLFDVHDIEIVSKGQWNSVVYEKRQFYLCIRVEGEIVAKDEQSFCDVYALNTWESSKGADRGEVSTICFDEFMTRKAYLTHEFVIFTNILSSIIRDRDGVVIYMLANTVNKYCPYFKEMGINHIEEMQAGSIELYEYGESGLTVAVELCAESTNTRKVKKYFAFDNPALEMITKGKWEIALYPHISPDESFTKEDILHKFYIKFDNKLICGDIIKTDDYLFILYHRHTGNHIPDTKDVIYMENNDGHIMHCKYLSDTPTEIHKMIHNLIRYEREFYSDNEIGEIVRNWKMIYAKGVPVA